MSDTDTDLEFQSADESEDVMDLKKAGSGVKLNEVKSHNTVSSSTSTIRLNSEQTSKISAAKLSLSYVESNIHAECHGETVPDAEEKDINVTKQETKENHERNVLEQESRERDKRGGEECLQDETELENGRKKKVPSVEKSLAPREDNQESTTDEHEECVNKQLQSNSFGSYAANQEPTALLAESTSVKLELLVDSTLQSAGQIDPDPGIRVPDPSSSEQMNPRPSIEQNDPVSSDVPDLSTMEEKDPRPQVSDPSTVEQKDQTPKVLDTSPRGGKRKTKANFQQFANSNMDSPSSRLEKQQDCLQEEGKEEKSEKAADKIENENSRPQSVNSIEAEEQIEPNLKEKREGPGKLLEALEKHQDWKENIFGLTDRLKQMEAKTDYPGYLDDSEGENNSSVAISSFPSTSGASTLQDAGNVGLVERPVPMTRMSLQKHPEVKPLPNELLESISDGISGNCNKQSGNKNKDKITTVLEKINTPTSSSSFWGLSKWGSAIVNTATASVSTIKSHVGEGLSTMMETMECTFGAVSPEVLAHHIREEERAVIRNKPFSTEESSDEFKIPSDISDLPEEIQFISRGIMATGNLVIKGSLETLELLGKTTMDIVTSSDRRITTQSLSEALREVKIKQDASNKAGSAEAVSESKYYFSNLFEKYNGMVHLEALELLSQQCDRKILLSMPKVDPLKKHEIETEINAIADICCLTEVDDDSSDSSEDTNAVAFEILKSLGNESIFAELEEVYAKGEVIIASWSQEDKTVLSNCTGQHDTILKLLVEITAVGVIVLHKLAELILLPQSQRGLAITRSLADLTFSICCKLNYFATKFSEHCNINKNQSTSEEESVREAVSSLITNLFLESSNCSSYIQDALNLVVPVLKYYVSIEKR